MKTFGLIILVVLVSLMRTSNGLAWGVNVGIDVPEECKKQGFCSVKPPGYDVIEKRLESILPQHLIDFHMRSSDPTIFTREDYADNCPSIVTKQSVYMYSHEDGKMDIIVQTNLMPQQITEVKCAYNEMENGDECFAHMGLNALNMKSSCRESEAERSLLVYDPRIDKIMTKGYNITVCCSCHITNNPVILS